MGFQTTLRQSTVPGYERARSLLSSCRSPLIAEMIRYWMAIHPDDRLPGRQHLDPLDIPALLPHVLLTDVQPNPLAFRIRVMGTRLVTVFGRDFTGCVLDETGIAGNGGCAVEQKRLSVRSALPTYCGGGCDAPADARVRCIEQVHLPLASDGAMVDKMISLKLCQALD